MTVIIQSSTLRGTIVAPSSKSSMQRAVAAAFLSGRSCTLSNAGNANDDIAALNIIRALGANVDIYRGEKLVNISRGRFTPANKISCGESGLSLRMFTPIIALSDTPTQIDGEGSLRNRSMDFFDEVLPQLAVKFQSNNGKLPFAVEGPIEPANIEIDGSMSSQYLTGLLMAFAAAGANDISISVKNLKSKPYVDLTLEVIRHFNLAQIENRNYKEFIFSKCTGGIDSIDYLVEADWSSASFLLVAGAIAGPVTVRGLDLGSAQADRAIVDVLMLANASIAMEAKGIKIKPGPMKGFEFDATDCPDLFPPLVALAAYCKGQSIIRGVSRLANKESNRAETLQKEFQKMGLLISIDGDIMVIDGTGNIKGAIVESHADHRIAMACAVAALKANGPTTIKDAQAVNKSYPDFWDDLKSLHAVVSLSTNKINLNP